MLKKEQDKIKEALSISNRISDILSGHGDAENQHTVDSWIIENEQNKKLFDKICSDKTMQEKIHSYKNSDAEQAFNKFLKARSQRSKRRTLYRILSGAAVVAVGFGIWGIVKTESYNTPILQVAKIEQQSPNMTSDKPILTLGDGTQMNVWGEDIHFKETEKGQQIMLGDSLLSQKKDSTAAPSYNILKVPSMCDFHFTLSDGTKVWMNASSTLKYPTKFASDSRTIYASGEIYLEVAKDTDRPFHVITKDIDINVLGTAFNIRAYSNEQETSVTLAEGKVSAEVKGNKYTLTPGKQLELEKTFGGVSVKKVDIDEILAWTKGYYVFKNSRLAKVANTLQNWYGVTIMMTSEISSTTTYTGVVNKKEELEVFLRRLEEVSNVKCSRNGKFVTIY